VRQYREFGHFEATSSSLRPESALETARSMRRAGEGLARVVEGFDGGLDGAMVGSAPRRSSTAIAWSSRERSSRSRRSASCASAARVRRARLGFDGFARPARAHRGPRPRVRETFLAASRDLVVGRP